MERIPYNNRGRGGMNPRYDRSQPRDNPRGRPNFSMPPDSYARPPMHVQSPAPVPVPHPGYGHPPPRPEYGEPMGGPRSDFNPRPAVVDATGASTDTAKHAK